MSIREARRDAVREFDLLGYYRTFPQIDLRQPGPTVAALMRRALGRGDQVFLETANGQIATAIVKGSEVRIVVPNATGAALERYMQNGTRVRPYERTDQHLGGVLGRRLSDDFKGCYVLDGGQRAVRRPT